MPGTRFDASTKAKAIRLVREHAGDYPTQWGGDQGGLGSAGDERGDAAQTVFRHRDSRSRVRLQIPHHWECGSSQYTSIRWPSGSRHLSAT
jgi:hypothetical protein